KSGLRVHPVHPHERTDPAGGLSEVSPFSSHMPGTNHCKSALRRLPQLSPQPLTVDFLGTTG
ncbi:MAG TPA: hypothetical protein PLT86_08730, partial [Candidatus Latescibacteria bacterium]|nr:hypothetical protein [Candidatus Latescibacterota bacterium]